MFQLSSEETSALRYQFGTSNGKGGRRSRPYVFTEQGVAMLSSVLRSHRAVQVNIQIIRTFIRLRNMLSSNAELSRKLHELEKKYDKQFKIVFEAIKALMDPSTQSNKEPIGFRKI